MTEHRLKILLVDDVAYFRDVMRDYFKRTPATIIMAESGQEALETALRESPDLIYMDVMMPGEDGLTLTASLRELWGNPNPFPSEGIPAGTPVWSGVDAAAGPELFRKIVFGASLDAGRELVARLAHSNEFGWRIGSRSASADHQRHKFVDRCRLEPRLIGANRVQQLPLRRRDFGADAGTKLLDQNRNALITPSAMTDGEFHRYPIGR